MGTYALSKRAQSAEVPILSRSIHKTKERQFSENWNELTIEKGMSTWAPANIPNIKWSIATPNKMVRIISMQQNSFQNRKAMSSTN